MSENLPQPTAQDALLTNIRNMRSFYRAYPIWNAVRTELSWTHYRTLLKVESVIPRR